MRRAGARVRALAWPATLTLGAAACSPSAPSESDQAGTSEPPVSSVAAGGVGRFLFADATQDSGLGTFRQENGDPEKPFIVETVGGGVALFDADLDGDLDAYLTNGGYLGGDAPAGDPRDGFFVNDGDGGFEDATDASGLGSAAWGNGVRTVDLDGDLYPEIFLTNYGPNTLYRNRADGTFEDVTQASGLANPAPRWSTGACFLDFERDGDLDLYVANYIAFDEDRMLAERPRVTYRGISVMKGPRGLPAERDRFFLNDGQGHFRDASVETGVDEPEMFGFQCVTFDTDLDGWLDVYVANDSVANLMWRNRAGERFEDVALRTGLAFSMSGKPQAGMGIGLGDYDGDLFPDLYVTNFADDYFTLYRGRAKGFFVDATTGMRLGEVTKTKLGWGCGFADFDCDGALEIFAVNGHVYPQVDDFELGTVYRQRNQLFALEGGAFVEQTESAGAGFAVEAASRGAALGDLDLDGDLDLLVGNIDGPPTLLRNESVCGNWLQLIPVGQDGNTDAIGARVVLRVGERRHLRLVGTAGSFLSSGDSPLHFGLGAAERADELEITWPDGTLERFEGLEAGRVYEIRRAGGEDGQTRLRSRVPAKRE